MLDRACLHLQMAGERDFKRARDLLIGAVDNVIKVVKGEERTATSQHAESECSSGLSQRSSS